ncbi:MAG: hypothetical protein AVDCRST_MAG27-3842, partial [uncultured Craurococcus sp.]
VPSQQPRLQDRAASAACPASRLRHRPGARCADRGGQGPGAGPGGYRADPPRPRRAGARDPHRRPCAAGGCAAIPPRPSPGPGTARPGPRRPRRGRDRPRDRRPDRRL